MSDWAVLGGMLRSRFAGKSLLGVIGVFRVSILLTALIIFFGRLTQGESAAEYQPTLDRFGLSYQLIRDGRVWHIFTGSLIQSDSGIAWTMILLVVCSLIPCELLAGHRFTLATFFLCDWIASLCSVIAMRLLAALSVSDAQRLLTLPDAGSSAASHGCLAAACTLLPGKLAWGAYGMMFGITIGLLFEQDLDAGLAHLFAVLAGGLLGGLVWKPWLAREHSETARNYHPEFLTTSSLE